jgi:hypothetical protein
MSQCPRVRAPGACMLVLLLAAGPAAAQTDCRTTEPVLTHPVELGHGPATGARYAAAARLHPFTVGLGCNRALRLGPTAALLYVARELDVVAGGHATVRVAQLVRGLAHTPLGLSAEAVAESRVSARNEGVALPDARDPAVRRRTVEAIVVGLRTVLGAGG